MLLGNCVSLGLTVVRATSMPSKGRIIVKLFIVTDVVRGGRLTLISTAVVVSSYPQQGHVHNLSRAFWLGTLTAITTSSK